jgi:hypothetical protein
VTGPVEIAAEALNGRAPETPAELDEARIALEALHAAGWSIVRLESAGLWEDPRFRGPYNEDERRPIDAYELFAIADEWTPEHPS